MEKVSVVIIAKNEEKQIRQCLESVKWADEIVVLDDCSTDKTVEISREYTDAVYSRKMDIEGRQRNYAYSLAKNEWILSLDCDERVTKELADNLRALIVQGPEYFVYDIPIKAFMGDRWIRFAGYYPARKDRFFRKGKFKYEEAGVHPRAMYEGKSGSLNGDIEHYSYKCYFDVINKLNRDTTYEAKKWMEDGRKTSGIRVARKACSRFLKFYIQKGGYRGGYMGFMFSMFHVLYQIFTYAHYCDLKYEQEKVKS